jgi:cytochrome c553
VKAEGGVFIPVKGEAGTEPLGQRVIEVPVNVEETELMRNPRLGFIAYVPPGSIKKGEALATTGGGGRFTPCTACHGLNLQGLGPVPPLAGRSPSHFGREVWDIQNGTRTGAWTPLMAAVVAALTPDDIVNLAAYTASLPP